VGTPSIERGPFLFLRKSDLATPSERKAARVRASLAELEGLLIGP
jgi:hypothetical protein